jgi:4-amino-4-deoxy-L-arabinose transferase-like glycosyltransferase
MAPSWPPRWYLEGPYREHPAGIFLLPALLARLGYPPEQAAYAVNGLYQVLSIVLVARLTAAFASPFEARSVAWLIQLIPIAFTYRVRANHEHAVLLFLLAALYATERARERQTWAALTACAFAGLALVKGLFAVMAPVACVLWLLVRPAPPERRRASWVALALATLVLPVGALLYDAGYRAITGLPFLSVYLSRQLGIAAEPHSAGFLQQKAYNVLWYAARLVWFAFPFSVATVVAAVRGAGGDDRRRGLVFALALAFGYLALFSLSDRKADRYVFPAYYALGAAGAVSALRGWPGLRRLAERLDRLGPVVPVAVWTALFALHVAGGWLRLPRIKLWPSD